MLTDSPYSNPFRDDTSRYDASRGKQTGDRASLHHLTNGLNSLQLGSRKPARPSVTNLFGSSTTGSGAGPSGSHVRARQKSMPSGVGSETDLLPSAPGVGRITRDWSESETGVNPKMD